MKHTAKTEIGLPLNAWSEITGVERRTMERRLRDVGVEKSGKYFLKDILRALLSDYGKARTRIAKATADRLEAENQKRNGLTVLRADIVGAINHSMAILFDELTRVFTCEFPPSAKGLGETEIKALAEKCIERLKDGLRTRLAAVTEPK